MFPPLLSAQHKTASTLAIPVLFTWLSKLSTQSKYFALCSAAVFLTALLSFYTLDLPLTRSIHALLANTTIHQVLVWFTWLGESQWYLIPSALSYWINRTNHPKRAAQAQYIFVVIAVTGIAVNIIKVFLGRYRPLMYFAEGSFGFTHDWIQFKPSHLSFPSGHTVTAFTLASAVGFLQPKYRWHFLIYASMIAASRVLVTAHYLSDVLIGAWFGVALTNYLTQRYFSRTVAC